MSGRLIALNLAWTDDRGTSTLFNVGEASTYGIVVDY